jgi:PAS domain S-box-containing protein
MYDTQPIETNNASILVVDDTHDDLRLLVRILSNQGYAVRALDDGHMAMTSAQKVPPDLFLLDIMMPGMTGYALCESLKRDERMRDIPVIFISALDEVLDKVRAFSIGGVDFITKPFQVDEVLSRVATHLSLQQMQQRLQEQNIQLQQEIAERAQVEEALRAAHNQLEMRVQQRTAELHRLNQALSNEIRERTESEERYRTLVETSPGAIFLTDPDGTIRFCNQQAATLFGYPSAHAMVGLRSRTLFAPTATREHPECILTLAHARNQEQTMQRQDGTQFPAELNYALVTSPDGGPNAMTIIIHDISARKMAEQALIEKERFAANARLSAIVAHEVNSPLQSIQSILGILNQVSHHERDEFVALAQDEIQRISAILQQLLNIYRPDTSISGPIDVNALIERVLLLNHNLLSKQHIQVERELDPALPLLWSRSDQILQVLLNLLYNAIEAMPEGGTLTLHTRTEAHDSAAPAATGTAYDTPPTRAILVVEVGDTGCGIEPIYQERIFDTFFTTKEQGTGLGLPISRKIVEQYGGTITAQSVPGHGSCFALTFPLNPNQ